MVRVRFEKHLHHRLELFQCPNLLAHLFCLIQDIIVASALARFGRVVAKLGSRRNVSELEQELASSSSAVEQRRINSLWLLGGFGFGLLDLGLGSFLGDVAVGGDGSCRDDVSHFDREEGLLTLRLC